MVDPPAEMICEFFPISVHFYPHKTLALTSRRVVLVVMLKAHEGKIIKAIVVAVPIKMGDLALFYIIIAV